MVDLLPVIKLDILYRWLWISISTPDFSIITPSLRPRFLPIIIKEDLGGISTLRYIITLTWFFHLSLGYGTPSQVEDS